MRVIYGDENNREQFSEFISKRTRFSLWQSLEWQTFQNALGRKTWMIGVEENGQLQTTAFVIKHPLPFGKSWLEVPRGPLERKGSSSACIKLLFDEIKKIAKQEKAVFSRINPFVPLSHTPNHKPAFTDHHPQTSLLIELQQPAEDILSQMKQKGRYNIKVAGKHGVRVERSTDATAFYYLLQETTQRDHFRGHNKAFYQNMIDSLGDKAALYYAWYEDKPIAGGIFTFISNTAVYYYGASSNEHRNVMAPYLIQWEAIKEARLRGCKYYDFLGIAPEDAAKNHPWAGVTSFKKKFGGEVKEYPKALDIVYSGLWYWLIRLKKRLRS